MPSSGQAKSRSRQPREMLRVTQRTALPFLSPSRQLCDTDENGFASAHNRHADLSSEWTRRCETTCEIAPPRCGILKIFYFKNWNAISASVALKYTGSESDAYVGLLRNNKKHNDRSGSADIVDSSQSLRPRAETAGLPRMRIADAGDARVSGPELRSRTRRTRLRV